jgi:hypothetical protein
MNLQSSLTSTSTGGTTPSEWLTAEVNNKLPSSLSGDGIPGTLVLFINIQYPFEQTGVGFNWGNPANHAKHPTLTLVVNKTSLDFIQNDSEGCPIVDAYTLSSGLWTNDGLGEISSKSISSTQCEIKIQSQHYSKFAFSLRHISSVMGTSLGKFSMGLVVNGATALGLNSNALNNIAPITPLPDAVPAVTPSVSPSYNVIADPADSFGNVECVKGPGHALLTGQYTNGNTPYKIIFLKMTLLDGMGHVLATGDGHVSDIGTHETKAFNAITRIHDGFTSCEIQVNSVVLR